METHFEKTLESQTVYEGRVITVTRDTALLEDGTTALRDVVHHHGGACILPYYEDGTICMVRQFRYAMQQELWELPAGKLEAGEDPFEAAKRELTEECGVYADEYISLGQVYPTVGYDTEVIYIWAARGLHPAPDGGRHPEIQGHAGRQKDLTAPVPNRNQNGSLLRAARGREPFVILCPQGEITRSAGPPRGLFWPRCGRGSGPRSGSAGR